MYKVLWWFSQISRSYRITEFCIRCMWGHTHECIKHVTPSFPYIFVTFMEKALPIIKFYGVFDHFSRTCEVAKSWKIKLYLCINDVIHANKQTKYVNCGLCVNFWNFLYMWICFMMKKNHFEQKLLFWPQVLLLNYTGKACSLLSENSV